MRDPFDETEELTDELAPPADLRRILGLARPYLGQLIAATSLMLMGTAIGLVVPKVAGGVVDAALVNGNLDRLNRIVLSLITLFAAMGITAYVEHYVLRTTGARMLVGLRHRLFSHLSTLSPEFYENRPTGELLSRMNSDLGQVQTSLTSRIPSGISAVLRFVGTLIILLTLQTRLTLVALAVVPPVMLLAVYFGKKLERLSQKERDANAKTAARAEETLNGIRTVQAFQREPEEIRRYGSTLGSMLGVQIRNAHVEGAFSGTVQFAAYTAFAVVLWYGGGLMLDGTLTPGDLTSFLLYTFSIAVSVGTLGALYAAFRELRGSSARIFQLLDTEPVIADPEHPVPLIDVRGALRFDEVDFAYGKDHERLALRDVNLEIEPGEVVGLVGPSGAGKSTVFNLLLRYHDPIGGAILLDGIDLRHLRIEDVRKHIAVVPQDIFLMSGSIEENLRLGRLGATDEELRRAAELAGADEFIDALPDGYASEIGQRGVRLSGGQRQRLAIARAFLRDPAVLLLDEATSALDPDSEQTVQDALVGLMKGRTTLVIAHRLVTARRADRILVFDGGSIVAAGTHDELYEANELYRRYWTLQSLHFQ